MKIKLKEDMAIAGKHCNAGTIVDVSEQDGRYLVNGKRATDAETKAKKAK